MTDYLSEIFGPKHNSYTGAFAAVDAPSFLFREHARLTMMREDFDLSEPKDLAAHAADAVRDPESAIMRLRSATQRGFYLCKSLWQQLDVASRIGMFFDETQTMSDFGSLN
ncbi:MAG TPA: hypothetical protein VGE55_06515 [Limnobacter sp.]|uniref:hypothetical protein n=1 Tax=Limnobacter sp. TaxID=2003368 RepID=UPI002EDA6F5A